MDMGGVCVAGVEEDLLQQAAEVPAMSPGGSAMSSAAAAGTGSEDEAGDLRRGPWTVQEDLLLVDYIAKHGEGRWNSLARAAGLRRTGKSCRLRWLNYLRPDVRRGNITAEEQLLILHLHSRWGNRWSKIAQHLPGRTDNEIKNYWRTRVQKHARQLRCDVNSAQFRRVVTSVWMPRLAERIQAESAAAAGGAAGGGGGDVLMGAPPALVTTAVSAPAACHLQQSVSHHHGHHDSDASQTPAPACLSPEDTSSAPRSSLTTADAAASHYHCTSGGATPTNDGTVPHHQPQDVFGAGSWSELLATAGRGDDGSMVDLMPDFEFGDFEDNFWSLEDLCLLPQSC